MVENEAVNAENAAEEKQTENTDIGTEGDADANGGEKPAQDNAGGNTSAGYPDEVGGEEFRQAVLRMKQARAGKAEGIVRLAAVRGGRKRP